LGDVVDPASGRILAGARPTKIGPVRIGAVGPFASTLDVMKSLAGKVVMQFASRGNTIIGVVATNVRLTKEEANKVAQMAHDGIARAVRPAHTMLDGDTLFAVSTGSKKVDVNIVGAYGVEVVAQSIMNAVLSAEAVEGLPAAKDLLQEGESIKGENELGEKVE
jgi:L-aminopeptidase/D-esterase-like protein